MSKSIDTRVYFATRRVVEQLKTGQTIDPDDIEDKVRNEPEIQGEYFPGRSLNSEIRMALEELSDEGDVQMDITYIKI